MKSILIFYLIGVAVMLAMIIKSNVGSNPKEWKLKNILKTLLFALGSWVTICVIAFKEI